MARERARLGVEALEGRDCPAVNFFNGVLTVTGTTGDDGLVVRQVGAAITAQGQTFSAAAVKAVVISGLDGDDFVRNATAKPGHLYGGWGNDAVYGGSATDRVFGGHGADTLAGGAGSDYLFGGSGVDALNGGADANTLVQGGQNVARGNSAIEQEIVRLVNVQRAIAGLPALTVNVRLNAAAWFHTSDMVRISNVYGPDVGHQHVLFGTPRPQIADRLDAAGYDEWTRSFGYGENIAYGFSTAAAVMNAWMNSQGHRANILSASFREIGVSVAADAAGRLYFTQNFGYRA